MIKYTEYKKSGKRCLQITIPVLLQPFTAHNGTKIQRTHSITIYARIENQSITTLRWRSIGWIDETGKPKWNLPPLLQSGHEAYKQFVKSDEQKRIESILHNEPVLKENAA